MIRTLLLCFIHGFKGNEETFFEFPEDLKSLVADRRKDLAVHTVVYPKYETRGDLAGCVEMFREWLQDKVTDLEVDSTNRAAITDPSVAVILIAHSMGGFVASDALFSVLDNRPISADPDTKLMFPLIHGLLSFDTPYNGLSRSLFAYGVFSQYQNISGIWNLYTTISSLGAGAASTYIASESTIAATSWARWGALASRTGTYGALIAGGAAAYANRAEIKEYLSKINRQNISQSWAKVNRENLAEGLTYVSRDSVGEGFSWMSGHLKFVGALMKQAQLKTRLERLSQLKGVGVANLYTSLGENGYWSGGYFVPKRTFCAYPASIEAQKQWTEQVNTKAGNEIEAHCNMFQRERNPLYDTMAESARDLILKWLENDPRKVLDEYKPDGLQLSRSNSEAQLFDDDGNVLNTSGRLISGDATSESNDELQLEAILECSGLPQPEDGGISDEDLQKAASVPLPLDERTTWKSKFPNPFNVAMPEQLKGVSMPTVSMPKVSVPSIPFSG